MKSEEIIVIINEICARIGATSADFMPKLVAYRKLSSGFGCFCCILVTVILWSVVLRFIKNWDEDFAIIVPLLSIFFVGLLFMFLYDLITWSIMPEIKSILYILSKMGG